MDRRRESEGERELAAFYLQKEEEPRKKPAVEFKGRRVFDLVSLSQFLLSARDA